MSAYCCIKLDLFININTDNCTASVRYKLPNTGKRIWLGIQNPLHRLLRSNIHSFLLAYTLIYVIFKETNNQKSHVSERYTVTSRGLNILVQCKLKYCLVELIYLIILITNVTIIFFTVATFYCLPFIRGIFGFAHCLMLPQFMYIHAHGEY